MKRHIDAEIIAERVKKCSAFKNLKHYWYESELLQNVVLDLIDNTPTAEVEEVRHAHWIPQHCGNFKVTYRCSSCKRLLIGYADPNKVPYCHCGAKMDEKVVVKSE